MKKFLGLFSVFFALIAAAQKPNLITTQSFDKISKTSTYNDLKKLYGAANIKDDDDYGAEGMDTIRVTKIFKDKKNEIVVYWDEKGFHKKIAAVASYQEGAPYYTADSIMVGSTLKKLLEVNGKKINFSGMGWDYGGAIISLNKGKLAKSVITYSLGSVEGMSTKLDGDVQLNTDMPIVKKNLTKVKVIKIAVDFIVLK